MLYVYGQRLAFAGVRCGVVLASSTQLQLFLLTLLQSVCCTHKRRIHAVLLVVLAATFLLCLLLCSDVELWILALGGTGIVVGLATYGYNIMRVLGVKCTHITPSRG
jgi:hypothetical protein